MPRKVNDSNTLRIEVHRGKVLGINVYRGFGRLCDLALISKADIYDQKNNPFGTQRDLSPKHAREAYEYVKTRDLAFWPEVFLCVRRKTVIKFEPDKKNPNMGVLEIYLSKPSFVNLKPIAIIIGSEIPYFTGEVPQNSRWTLF